MDLVKGFKDYTGKDAQKRAVILEVVKRTFEKYGFDPAETPVIEYEKFVKGENQNDEAVSDIYKLQDKGKRKLALRYEFTFQLKRLMKNKKLPFKRFQIGPVFRDEPISGNRIRQFTTCEADIVGSNPQDEAEMFALISEILMTLKIDFKIYFNNRKLLNEILIEQGIKKQNTEQVIRELDKLDKFPESKVKENLKKYDAEKVLDILKKPESYFQKYNLFSEILRLKESAKNYGVNLIFTPFLARGLSYYNGTIFEVKTKKIRETICGGGAYMFNNTSSIGFGVSIERLCILTNLIINIDKTLIVSLNQDKEAIKLAQKLRCQGKNITLFYGKPSKALEYANSYSIKKVIFVGEKEVEKKVFKIKDMKTGKQSILAITKKKK